MSDRTVPSAPVHDQSRALVPLREAGAPARIHLPPAVDAAAREALVQSAAFVHGARRALSPEFRNRVLFEVRRELKRARKARKVEVKEALREYRARHRAEEAVRP